jgi:hypothetical protein
MYATKNTQTSRIGKNSGVLKPQSRGEKRNMERRRHNFQHPRMGRPTRQH